MPPFGLGMGGAGVSAAPSPGFWSRFGGELNKSMPGMLSNIAQSAGPSILGSAAGAAGKMFAANQERKKVSKAPRSPDMLTAPTGNAPTNGIVRPYSPMNVNFGGISPMLQRPNPMNLGNMGGGNPMNMGNPRGINLGNVGINNPGLWQAYSRLTGLGGGDASVPPRGMFY